MLKDEIVTVRAFAPASCANVAVGYDLLGYALSALGDTVTLTRTDNMEIELGDVISEDTLPDDPLKNVATAVLIKLCQDYSIEIGLRVDIQKGIPTSSGLGGSAASAVGALVAFNAFLQEPLSDETLLAYAMFGESVATGSLHADNVVPCLLGGFTLVRSLDPLLVTELPVPNIYSVVVHPQLKVDTALAREALLPTVPLETYVEQTGYLANFIAALYQGDNHLLAECLQDVVIEPQRAELVKGFLSVKQSAIEAGAMGASLSGSGPSVFAWSDSAQQTVTIEKAMIRAFVEVGVEATSVVGEISRQGACVQGVNDEVC